MKIDKKHVTYAIKLVSIIYLIFAIMLLSKATYNYKLGYHNSDLGWNMRYLESQFHTTIYDVASDGNEYSGLELIRMGNNLMDKSLLVGIISSFLIGFMVRNLVPKMGT